MSSNRKFFGNAVIDWVLIIALLLLVGIIAFSAKKKPVNQSAEMSAPITTPKPDPLSEEQYEALLPAARESVRLKRLAMATPEAKKSDAAYERFHKEIMAACRGNKVEVLCQFETEDQLRKFLSRQP